MTSRGLAGLSAAMTRVCSCASRLPGGGGVCVSEFAVIPGLHTFTETHKKMMLEPLRPVDGHQRDREK